MTELQQRILGLADGPLSINEIASEAGTVPEYVRAVFRKNRVPLPGNVLLKRRAEAIRSLADGTRSVNDIARKLGLTHAQVKKTMYKFGIPRIGEGARAGDRNHQFVCGRRIDLSGYALVTVPSEHPYARSRPGRRAKHMAEHRVVMEQTLGRYLLPEEVVDHIDGLTLHNAPENLRLFASNDAHLRETLAGLRPDWSATGRSNTETKRGRVADHERADTYGLRKARGDVRLRQMILAALQLGIDSPHLLGSHRHFEQAQIDPYSQTSLKHGLAQLESRYAEDRAR